MLIIPDKIVIQLTNLKGEELNIKDVLISIGTKATLKNSIELSPFKSDEKGKFIVTKKEILKQAETVYKSGLMDYVSIETASSEIEIKIIEQSVVLKRIDYITNKLAIIDKNKEYFKTTASGENLNMLLQGAISSSKDLAEVLNLYESSYNKTLQLDCITIHDNWNKEQTASYSLIIKD